MNQNVIWNHEAAHSIFGAMSLSRFQFITRFITFDDKAAREDRWQYDKFTCMREFFEAVNVNNARAQYPSFYLAVDETLYPYRGHIGFKQYNPSKPSKYGLLYRSLCDATLPYTYYSLPYGGKPENLNVNPYKKYYVSGTDEYTKYLVEGVSQYNDIRGRNISMDRYFTSVTLAEWASSKDITIVGTMRLDRIGIPKTIKDMVHREERSTYIYSTEKDHMLVSYIDKKKSGKKNVLILTTMHDSVKVSRDQRKKPNVHCFYDHTKGRVDVVDLISSSLSTRIKCKRWPINCLAFLLDTVRTNSKTILHENKHSMSNYEFTYQLGKALVLPNVERRYHAPNNGLQSDTVRKMKQILGIVDVPQEPRRVVADENEAVRGRSSKCVAAIVGQPDYTRKQARLNNDIRVRCTFCRVILCKTHTIALCSTCDESL